MNMRRSQADVGRMISIDRLLSVIVELAQEQQNRVVAGPFQLAAGTSLRIYLYISHHTEKKDSK